MILARMAEPRAAGRKLGLSILAMTGVVAVLISRWPFRSHSLFSWDSANYAFALLRIDIAAHRPHPPGYLGYVLGARILNVAIGDPNQSLVAWNILVTALAAVVMASFAAEVGATARTRVRTTVGAVAFFVTSPLLWFYSEVAEIYPSEVLVTLLVAYSAWRTVRGRPNYLYWCAAALAVAAVFRLTAAILMFPLALRAWFTVDSSHRRRAALLLGGLAAGVAIGFLCIQPDLPGILWRHFLSSTSETRLMGGHTGVARALNRNVRDTANAAIAALGAVNTIALIAWLAASRRLPAGLDRLTVGCWIVPWLATFTIIHIGKSGYVLPLLPLAVLVMSQVYARQKLVVAGALILLQATVNVAHFVLVSPRLHQVGTAQTLYRNKPWLDKLASDFEGVLSPTAFTIRESDHRIDLLQEVVVRTCPSGDPIIFAGAEPVDWRRAMWYEPRATAIYLEGDAPKFVGRLTEFTGVAPAGIRVVDPCIVIWVTNSDRAVDGLPEGSVRAAPGLGFLIQAREVFVTPARVEFR
jgi:hypothetical protein